MPSTTSNKRGPKLIKIVVSVLFWLAVWQIISMIIDQVLLVPSPGTVLAHLSALIATSDFWQITATSLWRIMLGFVLGTVFGVALAVLTSVSNIADTLISPVVRVVRATPVVSFIILALVWIHSAFLPIFIVFLMVLPVLWSNVSAGITDTDKQLLEMARVFHIGRFKTVMKVYVPSIMPYFLAACISSIGLAWKSGIAAEVIASPRIAMGTQMQNAKIYLETPDVFAWTIVVIVLSLIIEKILVKLFKKVSLKYDV